MREKTISDAKTKPLEPNYNFITRELRYSVALIVIASLATGIIFMLLAKELGMFINHAYVPFIVMAGYAVIVVLLTMLFAHRFVGPFPRMKMELRVILGGKYSNRIQARSRDDIYIQSFVEEINLFLNEFEKMHNLKQEFIKSVDRDLETLTSCIGTSNMTKEELVATIRKCRTNVGELLKKYRYKYVQPE